VELCIAINRKDNIIGFYREIARYVGCPLDKTLNSSSVIDIYILRKRSGPMCCLQRVSRMPRSSRVQRSSSRAKACGRTCGARPQVALPDGDDDDQRLNGNQGPGGELRAPNGIRFRKQPDGLTRSIIAELLKERDERKALRNTFAFGSPQYLMYDMQQNVLK